MTDTITLSRKLARDALDVVLAVFGTCGTSDALRAALAAPQPEPKCAACQTPNSCGADDLCLEAYIASRLKPQPVDGYENLEGVVLPCDKPQHNALAAPCPKLCELCEKRGYVACVNTAVTTPIDIQQPVKQAPSKPERVAFEHFWKKTRKDKKASRDLQRHELQPQTYVNDSANRHWVTWQAAIDYWTEGAKP